LREKKKTSNPCGKHGNVGKKGRSSKGSPKKKSRFQVERDKNQEIPEDGMGWAMGKIQKSTSRTMEKEEVPVNYLPGRG